MISMKLQETILHAMEGDPSKRIATIAEMKLELEDPSKVEVTQRHLRLVRPNATRSWWSAYGLYVLLAMIAPILTGIAILIAHWR